MFDFDTEADNAIGHVHSQRPARSGTLGRLVGLLLEARGIMAPVASSGLSGQPAGGNRHSTCAS